MPSVGFEVRSFSNVVRLIRLRTLETDSPHLAELIPVGMIEIAAGAGHAGVVHEAVILVACFIIFIFRLAQAVVNFEDGGRRLLKVDFYQVPLQCCSKEAEGIGIRNIKD